MATAPTLARIADCGKVRPHPWRRAVIGGLSWGIALTVGFTVTNFWNCGVVCLSDVAINAVISVTAGVATIGPLVAVAKRGAGPS